MPSLTAPSAETPQPEQLLSIVLTALPELSHLPEQQLELLKQGLAFAYRTGLCIGGEAAFTKLDGWAADMRVIDIASGGGRQEEALVMLTALIDQGRKDICDSELLLSQPAKPTQSHPYSLVTAH